MVPPEVVTVTGVPVVPLIALANALATDEGVLLLP
jgi:hypothetical protein